MPEGLEEIWKRSVAGYESRNQADRARKWYRYHTAQAHRHRVLSDALVARHENEGACFAWAVGPEDDGPPVAA
jgi:hypothetical protein